MLLILAALSVQPAAPVREAPGAGSGGAFVTRDGAELKLRGEPFRFAGANNYYLMYKSPLMVEDVLAAAAGSGLRVMRLWGSLEIGALDDATSSVDGKKGGVYFQHWDGRAPAYNDGPDGLQRLDAVIDRAGQLGIKLVIPLVNNWNEFGGMDQYVRWAGGSYHDQFYTDPRIRQWYKDWIAHLLNRTNTINGLQYKDDPTIMTWELANEPRCQGGEAYPRSPGCSTATLVAWAADVSAFIKTIDANHLVSVGDEGFYCTPGAVDWTENCSEGVDTLAFTRLESIDVMSFHLYPEHWGKSAAWGSAWIARHAADARALDKPAVLGEFAWRDAAGRSQVYQEWTDTLFTSQGAGALVWILSGREDSGSYYPDYDGLTIYCPSPACTILTDFGARMQAGR